CRPTETWDDIYCLRHQAQLSGAGLSRLAARGGEDISGILGALLSFFFFKQKTAYEIGLGIPAEPLFRSKPLMTLTTVLYLSCALISGHLAMMLMELTKRR